MQQQNIFGLLVWGVFCPVLFTFMCADKCISADIRACFLQLSSMLFVLSVSSVSFFGGNFMYGTVYVQQHFLHVQDMSLQKVTY